MELIEVLASTAVHGVNLGEGEYSEGVLNYFVEKLPYTYVVQVYFKDVSSTMTKRILTACERNRSKLHVLTNIYIHDMAMSEDYRRYSTHIIDTYKQTEEEGGSGRTEHCT